MVKIFYFPVLFLFLFCGFVCLCGSKAQAGTPIPFTITLDDVVTVTGTPRLQLDIGGVTRYAPYVSGSGTNTLSFGYPVVAPDFDRDGITIISPIDLNGGTITDNAGNTANLIFTPPDTTGVMVQSYTAAWVTNPITAGNASSVDFDINGAPTGATFNYTITSDGGGTPVTGSGTITANPHHVTGVNVTPLSSGNLTLSVTATNATGTGNPKTATIAATINSIHNYGSYRAYADGSNDLSCNAYRTGSAYTGDTGDGVYRIDPDGAGAITAFDVYCDMTTDGGGWTQVGRVRNGASIVETNGIVNNATQQAGNGASMAQYWFTQFNPSDILFVNRHNSLDKTDYGYGELIKISRNGATWPFTVGTYNNATDFVIRTSDDVQGTGSPTYITQTGQRYASHASGFAATSFSFTINNVLDGYASNSQYRIILGPTIKIGESSGLKWWNFYGNTKSMANLWNSGGGGDILMR